MTDRRLLFVNLGGVIAFGLFVFLSFVTAEADSTQRVMILISEIVGGITLIAAIISVIMIKNDQRFVPISILAFLLAWLIYGIGYEFGIGEETAHEWIWFTGLYIVLIAGFVLMRMGYKKSLDTWKLIPAFLIFINAILFVFLLFIQVWWLLPFNN